MTLNLIKFLTVLSISFYSLTVFATNAEQTGNATAQEQKKYSYIVTIDKEMSSKSSADIALSAIEFYRQIDGYIFANSDNIAMTALSYLTKFISTSWIMIANHEIGGHGARAREFDLDVSYEVRAFSGVTYFNARNFYDLHPQKRIATISGGMQASYLLSENIKNRYFESNTINPTYAIGYFHTRADQPTYIFSTKKNSSAGNDVNAYIQEINHLYGKNYLTINKLRSFAVLDLVDPLLFYSIYSYGINEDINIPMFKIGNISYLPATRAVLTPYGPERRLINHFKIDDRYFQVNLSYGKNKQSSYGLGIHTDQFLKLHDLSLGFDFNLWSQPKILTLNPINAKTKIGGLLSLNTDLKINKDIKIVTAVEYKTAGFIEGSPLEASAMIRWGFRVNW